MNGDISRDLIPISKGVEVLTFDGRAKVINSPYQGKDEVPKAVGTNNGSEWGLVALLIT